MSLGKGVIRLYISLDKVLEKIDNELRHARQSTSDVEVRTNIYTIKSLCELVLADNSQKQKKKVVDKKPLEGEPSSAKALQEQKQSSRKTVEKDYYDGYEDDNYFDEANGDSIFDF